LFKIRTKRELQNLLNIKRMDYISNINVYNPYISENRLIESPSKRLKDIQKKINTCLAQITCPDWLISQKGKSFIDNCKLHTKNNYMIKIDIQKFFPRSKREYIYIFFKKFLYQSSDVAKIFADLTTINYDTLKISPQEKKKIMHYFNQNKIISLNHLPSGAPTSPILSFLCFHTMFFEIKNLVQDENLVMTLYVDDITISGDKYIEQKIIYKIKEILNTYGHSINVNKIKVYKKANVAKNVTGVIINKSKMLLPNKLHQKIKDTLIIYKQCKCADKKRDLELKILGIYQIAKFINPDSIEKLERQIKYLGIIKK
jgi:RNA-directed DNA polymerase